MKELTYLMVTGKVWYSTLHRSTAAYQKVIQLKEPRHTILNIPKSLSDGDATTKVRDIIEKVTSGRGMFGRKVLLRFEN